MLSILFIDADPEAHLLLKMILPGDCLIASATDGKTGIELARTCAHDLILLDLGLPDVKGMEVLGAIAAMPGAPPVVLLSESSDPCLIVRAIKAGAYDFLLKPIDRSKVQVALDTAVRFRLRRSSPRRHPTAPGGAPVLSEIVGESAALREVCRLVETYAGSNATVLVTGESGTGKELVARAIHRLSTRNGWPFIAVNCAAIPETLIESELFGAEKGAYTDAVTRPGLFELASGGTLFLDEIGELDLRAQVKILRILESRELSRIGGTHPIPIDVRIVAATNRDLKEAIGAKSFRQDLYYRVHILPLDLPPLRARKDDVPLLVAHFLKIFQFTGRVTYPAIEMLCDHQWPGNIRELRNVVERAVLLADQGVIESCHIWFG